MTVVGHIFHENEGKCSPKILLVKGLAFRLHGRAMRSECV